MRRRVALFDVVADDWNDASIRPNQLFALSLPFPLVDQERARVIAKVCQERLLTPVGLRTLAPEDVHCRPRFEGNMAARDSAYHQGTVWPWLIGPFVAAYMYAYGRDESTLAYGRDLVSRVEEEMTVCCLGSISEVYDGNEPRRPGGCPAQLWSVAQFICAKAATDFARK